MKSSRGFVVAGGGACEVTAGGGAEVVFGFVACVVFGAAIAGAGGADETGTAGGGSGIATDVVAGGGGDEATIAGALVVGSVFGRSFTIKKENSATSRSPTRARSGSRRLDFFTG